MRRDDETKFRFKNETRLPKKMPDYKSDAGLWGWRKV